LNKTIVLMMVCILLLAGSVGVGLAQAQAQAQAPTTNFRYLAADPSLRAALSGATVRMAQATYVGKVLEIEEDWETDFELGYPGSVVTDPASGKLRMYYELMYMVDPPHHNHNRLVGLAESDDGINWTKPALNIAGDRYSDDPPNNFIDHQDRQWVNGPCVFVDPNAPPQARYKMSYPDGGTFLLGVSADGLHFHDVGVAETGGFGFAQHHLLGPEDTAVPGPHALGLQPGPAPGSVGQTFRHMGRNVGWPD